MDQLIGARYASRFTLHASRLRKPIIIKPQVQPDREKADADLIAMSVLGMVALGCGSGAQSELFLTAVSLLKPSRHCCGLFFGDVMIFAWSVPLFLALGPAVALARGARSAAMFPLGIFGAVYVDVFRGVPVVLTIYLIGFGISGLGLPRPWNLPCFWGAVALVLTYSAHVAEVLRSGIESVHTSQLNAAICLGLSERDTLRSVILSQAIRRVVPDNMNMLVALQKAVALLSFIGPVEILRQPEFIKACWPILRHMWWPL